MHVFPQAFPLRQIRQQEREDGDSWALDVPQDGSCDGASTLTSDSHDDELSSMTHSASPVLTSRTGRLGLFTSAGASSSGSGTSASRFPRHPNHGTTSAMTVARTCMTLRPCLVPSPSAKSPRRTTIGAVLTALLSLAACGGVNTGQSLEVPAPPEAVLGHGFDSLSGLTRGACVDRRHGGRIESGGASSVTQVFYARSKEEIMRQIGFSGGASFGIFGLGVNLGFEALDRDAQRSTTTFAVIRIQIEAPSETLQDYRLAKHAVETLRREGTGKFYEKCGDGFVAAIRQGGLFLGIVALDTVANEDVKRLSGSAGVSFLGFGVEGEANYETRNYLERHRARYYIVQNGGGPGGWTSVKELESIDSLLRRARDFTRSIDDGRTVPTRLVVRPYQVSSNLPRRSSLWSLIEQRRFLDELAVSYGDVKRASAELADKMAQDTCISRRETRELEQLKKRYASMLTALPLRAQDCLNDPRRHCTDRGLDQVDAGTHQTALQRCKPQDASSEPDRSRRRPGRKTECKLWQLSSISMQVASRGQDATRQSPVALVIDRRKILVPIGTTNPTERPLTDVYVKPGATVRARVFTGALGTSEALSGDVPAILPDRTWTLENGSVKAVFQTRCVE